MNNVHEQENDPAGALIYSFRLMMVMVRVASSLLGVTENQ